MDAIPNTWPPGPELPPRAPVPMFPLGGVFLFPGQLLPLHIFEERYRAMVRDALDGVGHIVMATVCEGQPEGIEGPEVLPVAGRGTIERHEQLDDGRFIIWLVGTDRVRIREVESDRPYRMVDCEPILEPEVPIETDPELRGCLIQQIRLRSGQKIAHAEHMPVGVLADILAHVVRMPPSEMAGIFSESDPLSRARRALKASNLFPKSMAEDDDKS